MSYTALYRKIRPRTFKEIIGQPHIVRALVNQLVTEQINHAYLFCGTRGTGKTSAAKIFARAVNCTDSKNGEPCNACEMCKMILNERSLDVAEIDAASNNGVENIRDLREEVKYMPNEGRYKVYIIDEVHMLSASAFNALLKTLEEPPPYVIFILATTDPQKIPATILSRCQRYDFRRISSEQMTAAMGGYLQNENIPFEDAALDYIAYHSDGAMRDALSLLDQCISVDESGGLTLKKVRDLLGAVDKNQLVEFTAALVNNDCGTLLSISSTAMENGRDVMQFAADLIRHFRDVLVADLMNEQQAKVPREKLMEYIHAFSDTLREMRFAPHMRTAFEVCALKLCMPQTVIVPPRTAPVSSPPVPTAKYSPPPSSDIQADWGKFCAKLPVPIRSLCLRCEAEMVNGMLKIFCGDESSRKLIEGKQTVIRETLAAFFKLETPPNLAIEVREAYNKPIINEKPLPGPPQKEEFDWTDFGQEIIG